MRSDIGIGRLAFMSLACLAVALAAAILAEAVSSTRGRWVLGVIKDGNLGGKLGVTRPPPATMPFGLSKAGLGAGDGILLRMCVPLGPDIDGLTIPELPTACYLFFVAIRVCRASFI